MQAVLKKSRIGGLLLISICSLAFDRNAVISQEPNFGPDRGIAEISFWGPPPQAAHRVVKQPQWLSPEQAKKRAIHGLVHPPVATIQGAVLEEGWRQPYAYGFFGAVPHRHPVRHFGVRKNYTQWTWK